MMSRQPPTPVSRKRAAIGRYGYVAPHVVRTDDSFQCQLDGIGGTFAIPLTYYSYPVGWMIRKNVGWRLGGQKLMMMSRLRGRNGETAGFDLAQALLNAARSGRVDKGARSRIKQSNCLKYHTNITQN